MNNADLLREIRDALRANTEATKQLVELVRLMNDPVIIYPPASYTPLPIGLVPLPADSSGTASGVDKPQECLAITDQERDQIERAAFEKFRRNVSPQKRDDVAQVTNWDPGSTTKAP